MFDRIITLYEGETKSGEARKIVMSKEVYQLLAACVAGKETTDYVFTRADGRKKGKRVCDPREEWYALCVACGLGSFVPAIRKNGEKFNAYRGLNLHDFRHSAIRNMDRRGVSQSVAMAISGHKTDSSIGDTTSSMRKS